MSSVAGPWRSVTRRKGSRATWSSTSRPIRSIRCFSTASSRTRSRWTSTPSPTARRCGSAGSCSTAGREGGIGGIMQHVEEAGVHSGDSACVLPPMSLGEEMLDEIRRTTELIALELGFVGLINIQYAVAGGKLHVIEANPRASRTVPFVSKATGAPLAKIACRLMLGERLADQDLPPTPEGHVSVKEA